MSNIIWSKITEDKEVCSIIVNSVIIGKLIIDKDPMDSRKWMCSFEGFPYRQIFCFDNTISTFIFCHLETEFNTQFVYKQF